MSKKSELDQTKKRSGKMKMSYQDKIQNTKPRTPMFGSTWVAIFLLLREELMQPRPSDKSD